MYSDLLLNRLVAVPADGDQERIDALIEELDELDNLLSPEAQEIIRELRQHSVTEDVYEDMEENASLGDKLADKLAAYAGSWRFIFLFMALMVFWVYINLRLGDKAIDPFPFILLNLGLSTLAALQAPVILMSQNRQASKDRALAQNTFQVNLKAEGEIADLHRKLDSLTNALELQTKLVNALVNARREELRATVRVISRKDEAI